MSFKMWKEKPPGPEQKELERMFNYNEIDFNSTPDSVYKSNKIFQDFSSKLFSAHFRKTKAKLGLSAKIPMVSETEMDNALIKELGSTFAPASAAQSSKTTR